MTAFALILLFLVACGAVALAYYVLVTDDPS